MSLALPSCSCLKHRTHDQLYDGLSCLQCVFVFAGVGVGVCVWSLRKAVLSPGNIQHPPYSARHQAWITSLCWCVQLPFWPNGPLYCIQEHPGSLSISTTCLEFAVASLSHTKFSPLFTFSLANLHLSTFFQAMSGDTKLCLSKQISS